MDNMPQQADAVAKHGDVVEIRLIPSIVDGQKTLYVDLNGITVLRIGRITADNVFKTEGIPGAYETD